MAALVSGRRACPSRWRGCSGVETAASRDGALACVHRRAVVCGASGARDVANITNASEVLVTVWTALLALVLLQRRAMEEIRRDGCAGRSAPRLGWHGDPLTVAQLRKRWWRTAVTCAVAVVAVTRAFVLGGPVTGQPIAALGIADMSGAGRVVARISLVPRVAELVIWPQGINPHYGPSAFPAPRIAHAVLGALIILAALAERTLYLASVGAAMLVGLALDGILGWLKQRGDSASWTNLGGAAVGIALVLFAARSARWTDHSRSHDTLFATDRRGFVRVCGLLAGRRGSDATESAGGGPRAVRKGIRAREAWPQSGARFRRGAHEPRAA